MKKISCPLPASPAASPHRHLFERPSVPGGKGKVDTLSLTDARQDNLWFSKTGQDLRIKVLGKTDQVTVKDWYAGAAGTTDNHIERIKTADGKSFCTPMSTSWCESWPASPRRRRPSPVGPRRKVAMSKSCWQ